MHRMHRMHRIRAVDLGLVRTIPLAKRCSFYHLKTDPDGSFSTPLWQLYSKEFPIHTYRCEYEVSAILREREREREREKFIDNQIDD